MASQCCRASRTEVGNSEHVVTAVGLSEQRIHHRRERSPRITAAVGVDLNERIAASSTKLEIASAECIRAIVASKRSKHIVQVEHIAACAFCELDDNIGA